jgi:precorrin-4/cobalt-precorrin-4 C11-methyltransferase
MLDCDWSSDVCSSDLLAATARERGFAKQTCFLVLPGQELAPEDSRSKLYDPSFSHGTREGGK